MTKQPMQPIIRADDGVSHPTRTGMTMTPSLTWEAIMAEATKPGPPRIVQVSDLLKLYREGRS